ncbi:MAG: type II toxin-antitoxin system HicB family antitoxin [Mucispirillum sp.]|nr:type II toxin-antitoxin system HicB family antitoxin [Mucispirillum sp.]
MNKMNKLYSYPAIFYKEDDGGYSVIFSDLKGATTCGDNLQEAIAMAIDCLAGYLHSLILDNEEIPAASNIQDINDDVIKEELEELYTDKSRVFVNIISVNVAEYAEKHFNKSVKKMVTIPQWMADMAAERKLKLSKILQDALKEKLQTT